MMLKLYKYGELLDFQRSGHFLNVDFGIKDSPTVKLLPFNLSTPKGLLVSEFKALKIQTRGSEIITLDAIDINTALLIKSPLVFVDNWYYLAGTDILGIIQGTYQFYIKFSDGSEYYSELFKVPCALNIIECLPDFNNDFNNDFLTCETTPLLSAAFNYGMLYNWFAVNTGKLAPTSYRIPSNPDVVTLANHLGGVALAGGVLKSTRITVDGVPVGWNTPNTLASNDFGLNFLGSGTRFGDNGAFEFIGELGFIYTTDSIYNFYSLGYDNALLFNGGTGKKTGFSARCLRDASTFEQTLLDGTNVETVYDEDGNFYNAIKIGTQIWFNQNLKTTKYNDGTDITLVTDNAEWAALATEAYCSYNNDLLSVYEDPTFVYYE